MTVTPGAGAESIRWWQLIMSSGVTAVVVAAAYAVYGVPESAVPNLAVDVMELSNLHAIDTSDVHTAPDDPAVLIVDASISHRAEEAQHYPWLELTLTDAHDRPVARRALSPDDYLGKARSPTFLSGTNVQVSFRAHISALPESGAVTRYRLYLFFPSTEPERLASQLNADALRLVVMPTEPVASPGWSKLRVVEFDTPPDDMKPPVQTIPAEPKKNAFGWAVPSQSELRSLGSYDGEVRR